jgi:hypothetical protein
VDTSPRVWRDVGCLWEGGACADGLLQGVGACGRVGGLGAGGSLRVAARICTSPAAGSICMSDAWEASRRSSESLGWRTGPLELSRACGLSGVWRYEGRDGREGRRRLRRSFVQGGRLRRHPSK